MVGRVSAWISVCLCTFRKLTPLNIETLVCKDHQCQVFRSLLNQFWIVVDHCLHVWFLGYYWISFEHGGSLLTCLLSTGPGPGLLQWSFFRDIRTQPGARLQGRGWFSIVEHVDSTVIMGRPIDLSRGRKKLSKRSTTNHNSRWLPSKNSRWTIDYD